MNFKVWRYALSILICLSSSQFVHAESSLPTVIITADPMEGFESYRVDLDQVQTSSPDTTHLLRKVPGANFNNNGSISGQVQYRGMFGGRVNTRIDGMHINPGGPNWMDPPLHYVPQSQLESLEVIRGIAPVSSGSETIGGTVRANSRKSHFTEDSQFSVHGHLEVNGRDINNSFSSGEMVSVANDQHRFHISGSNDLADDTEFKDGKIKSTEYERHSYGVGYGFQTGDHAFGLDLRRSDTGKTGNPVLPMDMMFTDTDLVSGQYNGQWQNVRLEGKVYYSNIDHRMDNFTLRDTPDFDLMVAGPDARYIIADSRGVGYDFKAVLPAGKGQVTVGTDSHLADHDATVFNPDNAAFIVDSFNDVEKDQYGVFAEWYHQLSDDWSVELGARYNRVKMDAGPASVGGALPAPAVRLKDAFNSSDRNRTDDNFDWVAQLSHELTDTLTLQLGAARKTRSPSYIERFAWIPIEATAGLADYNNYVGDIALKPEIAREVEVGLDWRTERIHFAPRGFYRRVQDYIQGVAIDGTPSTIDSDLEMVSNRNGDASPLRFANVEAAFFGFDTVLGIEIASRWHLNGVLSYVRGKRKDIEDDLFRIPPFTAVTTLTYQRKKWSTSIEGVFAARQDNISETIVQNESSSDNRETPGYGLLNLYGQWLPKDGIKLIAGIDNVLNKKYADHLSGFNRVSGSDVVEGVRLPGPGRNAFLRVRYDW